MPRATLIRLRRDLRAAVEGIADALDGEPLLARDTNELFFGEPGGGVLPMALRWEDLLDVPEEFPPEAHTHEKAEITDFAHTHPLSEIGILSTVLQSKRASTAAVSTTTVQIPFDDTLPQKTEGAEVLTLTITPTAATSVLRIQALIHASVVTSDVIQIALFRDAESDALAVTSLWIPTSTGNAALIIDHYVAAGTTAEKTFKIRIGPSTGSRTVTINGVSGARKFGGALVSSLHITELSA